MGNALTDILINLRDDGVLSRFSLPRGSMNLVGSDLQKEISDALAALPRTLSLGGSASNTIRAMASLGIPVGYIGKVGKDQTGDFFEQAMHNMGIKARLTRGTDHSGICVSLVSQDGERTMCTSLGAALEMTPEDMTEGIFGDHDCLYIEGYLVQNHDLIRHAVKLAKRQGLTVAIDLSSFNVVKENLEFLRELASGYVDIIFANEAEAEAFTGESDPLRALDSIYEHCDTAVVKVGHRGAYIKHGGEVDHVGVMKTDCLLDTTGAGDMYAAGFLSGMCKGLSMAQCGTIGAIVAGKVIQIMGTTFGEETWRDIERLVKDVEQEKCLF